MRASVFAILFCATQAFAQAYPAKPVRIVVGFPPGGSGDFLTRLIADEMAKNLGVAVVAENRAGRVRALAVSKREASPAIPGIPGAEEAGLPGYEYTFWFGLYVPAGTPSSAVARLHEAAVKGLARPEVREKIALQGMDPTPSASPQAFEAEIGKEAPVLEKLIRDSGARVE